MNTKSPSDPWKAASPTADGEWTTVLAGAEAPAAEMPDGAAMARMAVQFFSPLGLPQSPGYAGFSVPSPPGSAPNPAIWGPPENIASGMTPAEVAIPAQAMGAGPHTGQRDVAVQLAARQSAGLAQLAGQHRGIAPYESVSAPQRQLRTGGDDHIDLLLVVVHHLSVVEGRY